MGCPLLVIDDDADFRTLVRIAMSKSTSFSPVLESANVDCGLVALMGCSDVVVLLDHRLPGALAAVKAMERACPGAVVILTGAIEGDEMRAAVRSAGAVGLISKATPPSRLAVELSLLSGVLVAVESVVHRAETLLPVEGSSVRAARQLVHNVLCEEDSLTAENAALLVSELVTNSVVHARTETALRVALYPDAVRIEVDDLADEFPVASADAPLAESGRGFEIMKRIAGRWGVRRNPGGGKTVWFELRHPVRSEDGQ